MKKEFKMLCGVGACGVIVGGIFVLKKLNERLTRIQMALYDIANSAEEIALTYDPMIPECINDNVDEIRNHTDDIASCIIAINQVLHPEPKKRIPEGRGVTPPLSPVLKKAAEELNFEKTDSTAH